MFKAALSALTSAVVSSAGKTIDSYKPTAENANGSFERIAHQGIANLSYRSPVLADIAETMLKNFQIAMAKREEIANYIKSGSASNMRDAVSQKLGTTDLEKVNAEMLSVLTKLSKSVDTQGLEETKKSALFKEYETYFEEFKKANPPKQQNPQQQQQGSPTGVAIGGIHQLDKIEAHTQRTVNVLEEMSTQKSVGGGVSGSPTSGGVSFIDPVTGMPSMRAAIGSIGGSLLSKIFDDDFTDKIAGKFKGKKLEKADPEELIPEILVAPTPKKKAKVTGANPQSVSDILGDLSLDLNVPASKTEDSKEAEDKASKRASELVAVEKEQLAELKLLNQTNQENVSAKKTGLGSILDKAKDTVMNNAGGLISKALPLAGSIAAVGAAGAAGYGIGKYLVNPLIDSGLSAVSGKETTLGGSLYDLFNDDPNAKYNEELKKKLAAQKKQPGTVASNLNDKKIETESAQKQATAQQIIAVNSQNQTKTGSSSPIVMIQPSIRNQDSTFERVQMQDFWPRVS